MQAPLKFPSRDEALALHTYLIEQFGGESGIRDLGLLESALHRPQTGYYDDIFAMAAALLESLLVNHAFVDGNKRMAFFLSEIFLRMNGYALRVRTKPAYQFIMTIIAEPENRLQRITKWLSSHAQLI